MGKNTKNRSKHFYWVQDSNDSTIFEMTKKRENLSKTILKHFILFSVYFTELLSFGCRESAT